LTACLAQQSDFPWAYLFRSFANEKLQALAEAETDLQKALRLDPSPDARYVVYLTSGVLHFNQGDLPGAAADFRAAIALKPEQYNAYLNLAHVCLAQGNVQSAAEQMKAALALDPPAQVVAAYHLERGRALLRNKKYVEAIEASAAAVKWVPEQPAPHQVSGRAQLALGQYQQAEISFDRYLRQGGERNTDLFRGRGLARMKLGKYLDAVDDYTEALASTPDADIYQHRGWAHFFSDAWKLAQRDFSRAIELDSEMADAYIGRGLASVMLANHKGAVTDAEQALVLTVKTPEMMHNVACIFALTVMHVEIDAQNQDQDREALADSYRTRALEAVRQTLEMISPEERKEFWNSKILPDSALASIHKAPAFKLLEARYSQGGQ
jgi:tetratricopeptide (TPR) repeat protein